MVVFFQHSKYDGWVQPRVDDERVNLSRLDETLRVDFEYIFAVCSHSFL